jgi:hypothetical protein
MSWTGPCVPAVRIVHRRHFAPLSRVAHRAHAAIPRDYLCVLAGVLAAGLALRLLPTVRVGIVPAPLGQRLETVPFSLPDGSESFMDTGMSVAPVGAAFAVMPAVYGAGMVPGTNIPSGTDSPNSLSRQPRVPEPEPTGRAVPMMGFVGLVDGRRWAR